MERVRGREKNNPPVTAAAAACLLISRPFADSLSAFREMGKTTVCVLCSSINLHPLLRRFDSKRDVSIKMILKLSDEHPKGGLLAGRFAVQRVRKSHGVLFPVLLIFESSGKQALKINGSLCI